MINRALVEKMFEGFTIQRWNDIPRPYDLVEMDKAGVKLLLAYLIGKYEEAKGNEVDWEKVIYGCFFETLKKIVLSDIKAQVHRIIKDEYPDDFRTLNKWVVKQYKDKGLINDTNFRDLFTKYLEEKEDITNLSYRILKAAHKLSTIREFELVQNINPDILRINQIKQELNADINTILDLEGVQRIITQQPPWKFLNKVEQLRYQIRWGQTPRVPKTSVLGHSYFVSMITLLLIKDTKLCKKRFFNNIFCSLFHDLPEIETRDIISPVKAATTNLPKIVKEVENIIVEKELLPIIDDLYKDEIVHYYTNEFQNRILIKGKQRKQTFEDLNNKYNEDKYSPIDGEIIKLADDVAAFLEAEMSIRYGIKSKHLQEGIANIKQKYESMTPVSGIDISGFFSTYTS